ncbi:MAG TPA: Ig-like domain-containing protein, partial [Burkholderiaceae bacterium]|nr:Ig-like domain-containing protein [Burkholderiaceae bacterium]
GTYSFQTRVIDAGGLTGAVSTQAVQVDTGVPAAPTLIGTDDVAAVTGAIANGATINDNVPVLSGTAEPNATVTLTIDGTPVTVTANGAGNWSHTPGVLADGAHSVSATQTDAAGNVSPAVALSFTVDATAPVAPVFIGTDDVAPVIGTIANGSTINDVRPAISGTTAEPNATMTVTISGPTPVTATVVANGAGAWSFTPGANLADGGYSVTVTQTDAAGNTSPAGAPLTFTLDSAAPLSISTITAVTADSGTGGDFITNDSTLLVSGSNSPLAAGEVVQISLNGGASWQAVTQLTGASWSFDNTGASLANGSHSLQTRVVDAAGNAGAVSSQAVVIDTTAPSATSSITAITTDTGTGGDFVTSDNTLAITGTNAALGAGETVQISLNGGASWVAATPVTATSWSYNNTGSVLADGSYNFQTRVIDAAGNTGAVSSQAVQIDTAAPTATSSITAITADSGTAGDFVTNDATLVIGGANTALIAGETVQLSLDGGATWVSTTSVTATSWTFDNTGATLAAGTYSFQTRVIDAGGLTGTVSTQAVQVDTGVPAAPTLIGTDDVAAVTGAIANGATTNDNVPALSGTAQPNATVTLTIDGGAPVTVTANGAGNWSHMPAVLADGVHNVSVTQTDAAGNVSPAATLSFTVDATAPVAPVFIGTDDVAPVTGTIVGGSTINDVRPAISGTTAEPNATVTITFAGPTSVTATVVANGAGVWSFTPGANLADGSYSVTVTQTDAAGNTSAAGAPLTFTLDSAAPLSISTITAVTADSGTGGDFITNDSTLLISGSNSPLAAGEVVQVSLDGGATWVATTPTTATSWSFDNTGPSLADGTYSFRTRVVDAAGNTGTVSSQAVVIDATVPTAVPTIAAITDDSGAAGDFVTSDNTLAISGTNPVHAADEAVQLSLDGGTTWVAVTQLGATTWSYNNTGAVLADGTYSFQARIIDAAGNPGPASSQAVVIDTAAPLATSTITAITADSGTPGDFITNDTNGLTVTGANMALASGEVVQISLDGGATWVATTPVTGTSWTHTTVAMGNGSYSFQTRVIDAGGLTGPVASRAVVIDAGIPAAPTLIGTDDVAPVVGSITNGSTTNDAQPALSGTAEPNATVTITIDGAPVTVTANAAGAWSHTPAALADGLHSVSVTQTDAAGNTSPSATLAFTVDTAVPVAPTLVASDDVAPVIGAIANGSATNDNVPALSGTAQPNATVTLTIDGGAPVTVTANGAGVWSFTPAALADGAHSVSVTQTDAAGNVSPAAALGFTVDTAVPAAPTLIGTDDVAAITGAIANGATINDNVPVLSGMAEPNATVNLVIDGGAPVTVTANAAGAWSHTPAALADGLHSVSVTQTDAAGNVSPAVALSFTVDATAPVAPVFIGTDDVAPVIGTIANGSTINDVRPAISGTTAEPNATMTVTISGPTPVTATVVANGAGAWSFTPGANLVDGSYSVSVTQTDGAGNTSPAGAPLTFTLDSAAPLSISTITAITADSGAGGDFITSDPTLLVSGS